MEDRRLGRPAEELRERIERLKKKWEAEQRSRIARERRTLTRDGRPRKKKTCGDSSPRPPNKMMRAMPCACDSGEALHARLARFEAAHVPDRI